MRRTRRTVMALTAMGLLFVASACGDGGESGDQASTEVESATPAANRESATRQSAKSTAGSAADSGTTSTSAPAAESDDSGDSDDTPQTTSTSTPTTSTTRPAGGARPSDVCGEPGPDVAPIRGRTQDAPAECVELGTGDVQVTLRWASAADIDLHVTEPDGTEIWYGETGPSSTGGQLDVDSNVGCEQEASVENIFWPTGQAPSGSYTVEVNGYQVDGCGSGEYTVTAKVRGETVLQETGTVGEDETDTFQIEA